ncbi:MAG: hypothetical protein Q8P20_08405 [bacterium]|nr:hypothetical protein [bacterium]
MDTYTHTDRSLFFVTATIPVTNAINTIREAIAEVISHQVSLNERVLSTKTNTRETATIIRNKTFNPTDHLPNFEIDFFSLNSFGTVFSVFLMIS